MVEGLMWSTLLKELREIVWLASMVGGLSVAGVMLAVFWCIHEKRMALMLGAASWSTLAKSQLTAVGGRA
jgi:hypothetical protein